MGEGITTEDDLKLVTRIQETGDSAAFKVLYERHRARLARKISALLGNFHDNRDMEQEIWIKVVRSIEGFERKSSFYTWLYSIATNMCLNEIKKRRRRREIFQEIGGEDGQEIDDWGRDENAIDNATPLAALVSGERVQLLQVALEKLSENHQAVVRMYYIEGKPHAEIAAYMQCSEGTVRSRLFYALKHLNGLILSRE